MVDPLVALLQVGLPEGPQLQPKPHRKWHRGATSGQGRAGVKRYPLYRINLGIRILVLQNCNSIWTACPSPDSKSQPRCARHLGPETIGRVCSSLPRLSTRSPHCRSAAVQGRSSGGTDSTQRRGVGRGPGAGLVGQDPLREDLHRGPQLLHDLSVSTAAGPSCAFCHRSAASSWLASCSLVKHRTA